MKLAEYQRQAFTTAKIDWSDSRKRHIPTFGIVGELGSVTSELKKWLRDGSAYTDGHENLIEEFGDLLWYMGAIATRHDLQLADLAKSEEKQAATRSTYGHVYAMVSAFAEVVAAVDAIDVASNSARKARLTRALSAALQATLAAMKRERVDLVRVLKANLAKAKSMFGPGSTRPARCFDAKYPSYERLPRQINIHFLERSRGPGRLEVVLRVNEMNIGDRLTDNAAKDDGYRFHDAFHLAYTAVLGWSPVVRATFRCKRKSNSAVDEVQDGARAAIVEEAIAQTVFNYARSHSMLKGIDRIDHGILKLIQRMVQGLEVEKCALHEWQRAIFVGYDAFRFLKEHRGGWLLLDAETQSLAYSREGPVLG
jgi:NTP pyrophosphatase (non-canonical NTP hydrolase)